ALVAVVEGVLRPQDLFHPDVCAPQAGQGVLDPLALGPQLLGVRQVLEVAPAAPAVIGALGLGPVGRGLVD
ncbi:Helix-turn-helix, partial [Dysosmobacter welbionis]